MEKNKTMMIIAIIGLVISALTLVLLYQQQEVWALDKQIKKKQLKDLSNGEQ